jgi:hypothetical protein
MFKLILTVTLSNLFVCQVGHVKTPVTPSEYAVVVKIIHQDSFFTTTGTRFETHLIAF